MIFVANLQMLNSVKLIFFLDTLYTITFTAWPSHDHPAGQASLSTLAEFHLRNFSRRVSKVQLEATRAAGKCTAHYSAQCAFCKVR